jgi:hypothetical protein
VAPPSPDPAGTARSRRSRSAVRDGRPWPKGPSGAHQHRRTRPGPASDAPFATPARQSRTPLKDELLGGLRLRPWRIFGGRATRCVAPWTPKATVVGQAGSFQDTGEREAAQARRSAQLPRSATRNWNSLSRSEGGGPTGDGSGTAGRAATCVRLFGLTCLGERGAAGRACKWGGAEAGRGLTVSAADEAGTAGAILVSAPVVVGSTGVGSSASLLGRARGSALERVVACTAAGWSAWATTGRQSRV